MNQYIILFIFGLPALGFCDNNDIHFYVWKSTYYSAIPNQKNISRSYCRQHEPGTFIGIVDDQLAGGAMTNRQIKLNNFTFHQQIKNGIYFMQGSLHARGITDGKEWDDEINYYVYKLTEDGITRGVWNSQKCKGLYLGQVIKK